MSNDSSGEKTEQPTPKKRQDAKKQGQMAQSKELNKVFALIILLILLIINLKSTFYQFANIFQGIIDQIATNNLDKITLSNYLLNSGYYALKVILLPIIVAGITAYFINIIQVGGFTISEKFLKFDFNKFNLVNNFKSIYSFKNLIKFTRQLIEIIIMAVVAIFIAKQSLRGFTNLPEYSVSALWWYLCIVLFKEFAALLLINIVASIIDLVMEKFNLTKQLMMSLSEIKQEYKNTNGDPEIKSRRQELHRELIDEEGEATIANSTMVLANPTHIAIVLLYRPKRFKLPIIVAKASGAKAQNIFTIAKRNNIPIIRDKWLARTLFEVGIVGKYVPSSMLAPVADIISQNMHLLPKTAQEIAEISGAKSNSKPTSEQNSNNLKI